MIAQAPQGNASSRRVTGGADLTANQLIRWYEKG